MVMLVTAAGCSGGHSASKNRGASATTSATTATAPTTTRSVAATPDAAVITGYHDFWSTYDAYAAELAPFDAAGFRDRFGPVASDGEYDHLYQQFQLDRVRGWVSRGGEADVYRPKIVELAAGRAVVDDCADDTGGVFDTRNNAWIEPETPGAHSLLHVVLVRSDGRWKVTSVGGKGIGCNA
jgi:hypothetical protein